MRTQRWNDRHFSLWLFVWLWPLTTVPATAQIAVDSDRTAEANSIQDARQLLETLGVSESELAFFTDGQPFLPTETGNLFRLLNCLPRFPLGKVHEWLQHPVDWDDVVAETSSYRGQLLLVRGRLMGINAVELPDEVAERLGIDVYYRSEVRLSDDPNVRAIVFLLQVPRRLSEATASPKPFEQRVEASGLLLKSGPAGESPATVYLAANRLAWYPDPETSARLAHPDHVVLGSWGMDVGLFDDVVDREPLRMEDRECFYQLLATVGRAAPDRLAARGRDSGAIELLQNPDQHRGRFYTLLGTARRAIAIQVDDADIAERLGVSRYYEIEVFDAQARIQVRRGQEDAEGVVYSSYPVVFCTREIPERMPIGEIIHQDVKITGVFFKLWAYPTQYLSRAPGSGQSPRPPLQLSPLLIGRTATLVEPTASSPSMVAAWAIGLGFCAAMVGLWVVVWQMGRRRPPSRTSRSTNAVKDAPGRSES